MQELRLRGAPAKRHLLTELRFGTLHLPPLPPWEILHITDSRHLPQTHGNYRFITSPCCFSKTRRGGARSTSKRPRLVFLHGRCYKWHSSSSENIFTLSQTNCSIREAQPRGVLLALTKTVTVIRASLNNPLTHLHIFCSNEDMVRLCRPPRTPKTLQMGCTLTTKL